MVGNHWARQTEFWVRSFPTANNLAGVPATGARDPLPASTGYASTTCQVRSYTPAINYTEGRCSLRRSLRRSLCLHTGQSDKKDEPTGNRTWKMPDIVGASEDPLVDVGDMPQDKKTVLGKWV